MKSSVKKLRVSTPSVIFVVHYKALAARDEARHVHAVRCEVGKDGWK